MIIADKTAIQINNPLNLISPSAVILHEVINISAATQKYPRAAP